MFSDEGMLLKSIVNSAFRMLRKEPLEVAKHPVGMDEIVQDFERNREEYLENKEGVQIVGIVGLGGSGKTTLATEIYNRKISSFKHSSFLHDVRDAASRKVLHTKQKKLLEDLRIRFETFDNVKEGKAIVAHRLRSLCVLIVLDDVDHEDQLDALLPPKENLRRGSLVFITTRDMDVLKKWGITSIYKVKPLQYLHAKQLFCWHAFLHPFPLQGFEDLVQCFLYSCNGLPLSLKVIGGQLYCKRSREYWVSQLKKIQRILPNEILERLKVSYDALDEDEKEIFLDIACLFIGEIKSVAIEVWDASGWSGLCSWEALQNKCLVEIYEDHNGEERITMHEHLWDLGTQIAKTHSPQRIRFNEFNDEGTPFRGITDSGDRRVKFEWGRGEVIESTEKCAELLRGVLWLDWNEFKGISIPSWFPLESIIVLEFHSPRCLETLWEDTRPPLQLRELRIELAFTLQNLPRSIGRLQHLKRVNLRWVSRLSSLPEELCQLQLLEHLDLQYCDGLSSLPNGFGDLVNLRYLDLSECRKLERLPERFCELQLLEHLVLQGCDILSSLPNRFADLVNLQHLDLSYCKRLKKLPSEFCELQLLKHLVLRGCDGLSILPNHFGDLVNLRHFDLTYCKSLIRLPEDFCELQLLEHLVLQRCDTLSSLPNRFGDLANLQHLDLSDCKRLERLPESFKQLIHLKYLDLDGCESLDSLDNIPNLKAVYFLHYDVEIIDHTSVKSGELSLRFSSCYIRRLLPIICQLSALKELHIDLSEWLGELPNAFGNMSTLTSLTLRCSPDWKYLPIEISHMSTLQNLRIDECKRLYEISNLADLVSLTRLEVKDCENLEEIEGLEHLTSLENLVLWGCNKCKEPVIHSLQRLERLQTLNLRSECISDFGDCIQNIEMEWWPREMIICANHWSDHNGFSETEFSHFVSILDSFTFPGVRVLPKRKWSLIRREANLFNAGVVCYVLQCPEYKGRSPCVCIGKARSTCVELLDPGRWIVITAFKEVSCTVEDGVGGLLSLDVEYDEGDGEAEVLAGWVMVGQRASILDGFKRLFKFLCCCNGPKSNWVYKGIPPLPQIVPYSNNNVSVV